MSELEYDPADREVEGVEPEAESGAGYGNHAPDAAAEPDERDEDAR